MTHNLIYEKFMIEYDKANVTSSYPSLTKYEVATILDKAYLALIARKLTGNNTRRVPFEYDVKAIEDLRPLITSKIVNNSTATTTASNELAFKLPDDLLYYLEGQASYTNDNSETADNKDHFNEIVNLVDHRTAQRFRATNTNMPWIKQPVSFLQGDDVYVLYDTYKHRDPLSLLVTYLEKPASFVESLKKIEDDGNNEGGDNPITITPPTITPDSYTFTNSLQVTITAALADHIIYRINDGVWHEYTQSISITETSTVEAYVVLDNVSSAHVTKVYTKQLELTTISAPRIEGESLFINSTYISMYADEGCQIYYTKDGSDPLNPTTSSYVYSNLIEISETTTIKAVARKDNSHSTVVTKTFTKTQSDPLNIPSVTIQQCRYVPASTNQVASIYVEYYVSLNNVGVPIERRILIGNSNDVYRGTDIVTVTLSKLYQQNIQYNDGDCKVKITLRGKTNDILYHKLTADIVNLPSNTPSAPASEYVSFASQLEEETSNNLGEAMLGEIILQ